MEKFTEKSFKILFILLLTDKPLTTTEIAKHSGYPRTTIEPYVMRLAFSGYIIDEGRDKLHGWCINRKYEKEIFERLSVVNDTTKTILKKYDKYQKWVHLIDADSRIPNLAIMKISAYHKARGDRVTMSKGDTVGFARSAPDKIYISIVFKANADLYNDLAASFPNTNIDIGGSGVDLKKALPPEIESMKPDYSIYPKNNASIGFSSRGCFRNTANCPFCIVPIKEGKFRRSQHPSEWYNPQFDKIVFLDNNILADKEWFLEVTEWCMRNRLKVWFTQGLDIRRMDNEIARRIYEMPKYKSVFFAWDHIEDEVVIKEKIALLKGVGFNKTLLHNMVQFYVYVDSDKDYDSGVYRCRELKRLDCNPFVMYNIENKPTQRINDLRRWANRKKLFWLCDIDDYKPARHQNGSYAKTTSINSN